MFPSVIISTAIIVSKALEATTYGYYPHLETQNNSPFFGTYSASNPSWQEFRPTRSSNLEFNANAFWNPNSFPSKSRGIHGPQVDTSINNLRPQGLVPTFAGSSGDFNRPGSVQNSIGRRPQQVPQLGSTRPNLFLPPGANDADDIFIFDRPTSPRPNRPRPTRPRPTPPSTTPLTTTAAATPAPVTNCNCPNTPEYNPVCGTDGVTYSNPGKLKCAIFCGTAVGLNYHGSCVTTTTSDPTSPSF